MTSPRKRSWSRIGRPFAKVEPVIFARRVCASAFVGLLVLAGARSVAAQTFIEDGLPTHGTQHVIITVAPGREGEVINSVAGHGGRIRSKHPSINGLAADISGADVADLAKHGVVAITRDHAVHLTQLDIPVPIPTPSDASPQPMTVSTLRSTLGLAPGAAANLTSGVNGSGVGIAIIDSGIVPSADFGNRITGFYDFTHLNSDGSPSTPAAYDDLGHGTHIAGLIASAGAPPSYMFQGIAPNANLVVVKVLDNQGASTTSTVIAAIEFIVKNQQALGVRVINLSLGHPVTAPAKFDPLVQAIESAVRRNIVVVVAAGNDGPGYASVNSPGNSPSAITVGAADGKTTVTRADDYVPSFSSRGPTWYDGLAKPDVIAPGVNLFSDAAPGSTLAMNPLYPQESVDGMPLLDLTGTSMAAAVATGVIALELDANARQGTFLSAGAAKAVLEYSAVAVANVDALTQGTGQINAAGAVELASAINTQAPMWTWWLRSPVSGSSAIGSSTYSWAQNIIWGTSLLSGRVMFYNNVAWNMVWGTGIQDRLSGRVIGSKRVGLFSKAFSFIWGNDFSVKRFNMVFGSETGDNIIWGTADGGDNIIWGTELAPFRILGVRQDSSIRWAKHDATAIVRATESGDNIIWGTDGGDNIIWGTWSDAGDNIIWGTTSDYNIIWGTDGDNIIWGTSEAGDNIIWGTSAPKTKGIKSADGDNIIWGTYDGDNIIWGTNDDNIIWGTDGDNIIWGTDNVDRSNIIWGTSAGGQQ
jgi:serine protease AprX